jgi:hypothetical protein
MVVGSDRYRVREAVRDPRSIGLLGRCGIPFVSLLSDSGVSIEEIARLVGHKGGSAVTEKVYIKQPRPSSRPERPPWMASSRPRSAAGRRMSGQAVRQASGRFRLFVALTLGPGSTFPLIRGCS